MEVTEPIAEHDEEVVDEETLVERDDDVLDKTAEEIDETDLQEENDET